MPRKESHPVISTMNAPASDWAMTPLEKVKYEQLFESLQPLNGVIPGNKVQCFVIIYLQETSCSFENRKTFSFVVYEDATESLP